MINKSLFVVAKLKDYIFLNSSVCNIDNYDEVAKVLRSHLYKTKSERIKYEILVFINTPVDAVYQMLRDTSRQTIKSSVYKDMILKPLGNELNYFVKYDKE